jgi:hypothetical protein
MWPIFSTLLSIFQRNQTRNNHLHSAHFYDAWPVYLEHEQTRERPAYTTSSPDVHVTMGRAGIIMSIVALDIYSNLLSHEHLLSNLAILREQEDTRQENRLLCVDMIPNITMSECSICSETIALNEMIPNLTCKHHFHKGCLDTWITYKSSCPMCRGTLPTNTT